MYLASPGSHRGCVYQLTSQCGEVNHFMLVCRSPLGMCDWVLWKAGYMACAAGIWCYSCVWHCIHSALETQVLQEFGAACVCSTVYTQHWENVCSPGSCRGCVYQLTSQCGEVNCHMLVCRSLLRMCDWVLWKAGYVACAVGLWCGTGGLLVSVQFTHVALTMENVGRFCGFFLL